MFIRDYFINGGGIDTAIPDCSAKLDFEEVIEEDISKIILLPEKNGYHSTVFKRNRHGISILTPALYAYFGREYLPHPDYLRFLLSVYPDQKDIEAIDTVIFRPRFVQVSGVQLVSLYYAGIKTIILYLSCPHLYTQNSDFFINQDEQIDLATITDPHYLGKKREEDESYKLPPLFYIIKMIQGLYNKSDTQSSIEKFLLKTDPELEFERFKHIEELSEYFRKHGY